MRPINLAALSSLVMPNSVIVKQSQSFVKPGPTPPVPAEATALSRTHQIPSDLFLHPIFDITKAFAGVADPKVVDPSPKNRIDQAYYIFKWLLLLEYTVNLDNYIYYKLEPFTTIE
jgi:hypothetical protein